MIFFVAWAIVFLPVLSQAKDNNDDQSQIILLNDSASALEDINPVLSKQLAQWADAREKAWQARNTNQDIPPTAVVKNRLELRDRIALLNAASLAIKPSYPLIAQKLNTMAKDMEGSYFHGVYVGMPESDFFNIYSKVDLRGLRHDGPDEWFTYNEPVDDPFHETVTFYFVNQKLAKWKINDREELVTEYLNEFSFYQPPSVIYEAIRDVLMRMPYEDYLNATNRQRPMLFTEFYLEGTARFASSSEFAIEGDEPPCCKEGFTIIKLGMSLGLAKTPGPIEGVVAHEIAHRVLDSIRKGNVDCDAERRANRLIVQWGFKEEFREASRLFGQKKGDPAGCQEVPHKTNL